MFKDLRVKASPGAAGSWHLRDKKPWKGERGEDTDLPGGKGSGRGSHWRKSMKSLVLGKLFHILFSQIK